MTGFFALFILGTFWWYIITGCFVIWAIALTESESMAWTIVSLSIYLVFLSSLGKVNVFSHVFYDPLHTLLYVLGYFVIGVIWSFIKWWLRVNETAQRYKEERDKFFKEQKHISAVSKSYQKTDHVIDRWQSHIEYKEDIKKPVASKNKEKISVWIVYWPFSFFWSLINDIVKRIVEQFVIRFQKIYQSISDKAFKNLEPQALQPEKKAENDNK